MYRCAAVLAVQGADQGSEPESRGWKSVGVRPPAAGLYGPTSRGTPRMSTPMVIGGRG